MDVLTAQYPALFARKFTARYTDFQPNSAQSGYFELSQEKKRCFPFAFQMKHSEIFAAPGLTQAMIYLTDEVGAIQTPAQISPYLSLDASTIVSDTNGSQACQQYPPRYDYTNLRYIMQPYDNPAKFFLYLELTGSATIDDLISGSLDIWYLICFLK